MAVAINSHEENPMIVIDADPPKKFMDMYPELEQLNRADIGFEFDSNSKITEYTVRLGETTRAKLSMLAETQWTVFSSLPARFSRRTTSYPSTSKRGSPTMR